MQLEDALKETPYLGYAYAYPHKTAYRHFQQPLELSEIWRNEDSSALFLYFHIPFCEVRCGFCNLLSLPNPDQAIVNQYLQTMKRQAIEIKSAIGPLRFARLAVGGGTPSCLTLEQLDCLFEIMEKDLDIDCSLIPFSFEVSPATLTWEKLQLLKAHGVNRISIGVQSFIDEETNALGRPQKNEDVLNVLEMICNTGFETLNIDLIYGCKGQTFQNLQYSLDKTLSFKPDEIYLYPLYVRSLTGLDGKFEPASNLRFSIYQQGREYLLANGYNQISMRLFRSKKLQIAQGPVYCCQEDGMIGLGIGARSYTRKIHYSSEYAVSRKGVTRILQSYISAKIPSFSRIEYGFRLDIEDRQRRYIIKSLLHMPGLDIGAYENYFDRDPWKDFPQLTRLIELDLARKEKGLLELTPYGLAYTDCIGPWLYSDKVKQLIQDYKLR